MPDVSIFACRMRLHCNANMFAIMSMSNRNPSSRLLTSTSGVRPSCLRRVLSFGERPSTMFSRELSVACSADGDVIVADATKHKVTVFAASGELKFSFGTPGTKEGQLLYPSCVSYCSRYDRIVLAERAPQHQIQFFSNRGKFLAKFGQRVLTHPRSVAVDYLGQIIVVESRVMRITIFSETGAHVRSFKSLDLEFPNGVSVDERGRIYISDNRKHCVLIFDYFGSYLGSIGGADVTPYPIGVSVTPNGFVLVPGNHNNFNVCLFYPDGTLSVRAIRRAAHEGFAFREECCGVAVAKDGVVILANRNFAVCTYTYEV